jgi:hypothetical protein
LSALAVLSAVLPLALGWDSPSHRLHPFSGLWACAEVVMIGTVSAIYWLGSRHHWQEQWLQACTNAELVWYLPMLAPLLGDTAASSLLADAWTHPAFVSRYAQWTVQVLEQQRHYHQGVSIRQRALEHRVHRINICLFLLTAVGAIAHLAIHSLWLSLVTTFLPALGASLHGALAQSEAHRLNATSKRLVTELGTCIARIQAAMRGPQADLTAALRGSVAAAIAVILDGHQDWNLLIRPHHLPLG